MFEEHGLLA